LTFCRLLADFSYSDFSDACQSTFAPVHALAIHAVRRVNGIQVIKASLVDRMRLFRAHSQIRLDGSDRKRHYDSLETHANLAFNVSGGTDLVQAMEEFLLFRANYEARK
jgi:hypothetical protein